MRIVAFTKTDARGPSSRYRYYAYAERLRAHGVELEIRPLFTERWFEILKRRNPLWRALGKILHTLARFARRAKELRELGKPDLVVIEHQLFPYLPPRAERALARRGIHFTVEFDDAIYLTRGHDAKMRELCALATTVVVGNRFLAEYASRSGARRVAIVPTTIDLSRYPQRPPRPRGERLVIGWIGLPYNFSMLEVVRPALERLARERPIVLRIVSAGTPELPGVPIEAVAWNEATEFADLSSFDIGIMPLRDDEWSRGKCALKILQYFAAAVPVVASPVGVNADIVRNRENGLLARTSADWYEALRELCADEEFAKRLGAAGRTTVELDFSLEAWTPKLADTWNEIVDPQEAGRF